MQAPSGELLGMPLCYLKAFLAIEKLSLPSGFKETSFNQYYGKVRGLKAFGQTGDKKNIQYYDLLGGKAR